MLASRAQYLKYIYDIYGLHFALTYLESRSLAGVLTPSKLSQERAFVNRLHLLGTLKSTEQ